VNTETVYSARREADVDMTSIGEVESRQNEMSGNATYRPSGIASQLAAFRPGTLSSAEITSYKPTSNEAARAADATREENGAVYGKRLK